VRQAILSGQVPVGIDAISAQYINSGQFRVLDLWTQQRTPALPEVPTFTELGVPIVETSPFGIGAPRDTPAPVVSRLHDAFKHALDQPAVRDLFNRESLLVQYLGPQAFLDDVRTRYANERQTLVRLGLIS
jgi:tripartite-type tricarboxylate transporter receptor subunit TctC